MVVVRKARSDKHVQIAVEMDKRLFPDVPMRTDPEDLGVWLAWSKELPVAFAAAMILTPSEPDTVYLHRAGVLPTARGQHLQSRLIRARLAWARSHGCTDAITYTYSGNIGSCNNLIRCGFRMYYPQDPWVGGGGEFIYWRRKL